MCIVLERLVVERNGPKIASKGQALTVYRRDFDRDLSKVIFTVAY